jgi:hypothetical protein
MGDPARVPAETAVTSTDDEEDMGCCDTDFDHICTMIGVAATALNLLLMMAVYIYFVNTDDTDTKRTGRIFSGWKP